PRRDRRRARPGQAPRHQHVHRGPQGEERQEAAAQLARRATRTGEIRRAQERARRGDRVVIPQAQTRRLERLLAPPYRLGAADHARLLELVGWAKRRIFAPRAHAFFAAPSAWARRHSASKTRVNALMAPLPTLLLRFCLLRPTGMSAAPRRLDGGDVYLLHA